MKITEDVYKGLDCNFESFPADDQCDPKAYVSAIASMQKGDCVTIFTPDDTHFEIAMACVQKGNEKKKGDLKYTSAQARCMFSLYVYSKHY